MSLSFESQVRILHCFATTFLQPSYMYMNKYKIFVYLVYQASISNSSEKSNMAYRCCPGECSPSRGYCQRKGDREGCMWHTAEHTKSMLCSDTRHSQERKHKDPTKVFITFGDSK